MHQDDAFKRYQSQDMTLEQLKYLQAIVKHGSFRAAAAAVYRSQSSVSIAIQKLEEEMGITIFKRSGYRPILTSEGKVFHEKASALLNKSNELQSLANHLASGAEAELHLAISGIVPIEPIIKVLDEVAVLYPETRINMLIENLGGTIERMLDGDADIAITDVLDDPSIFESASLTKVEFVSVLPSSSPLVQYIDTITEQVLEKETLIIVRDTSQHSERITKGIPSDSPQWVVNDFSTKLRILSAGKGWGRMPLHLVKQDVQAGRLSIISSPAFPHFFAPASLVRKKEKPKGKIEQILWDKLCQIKWS
ncbi:MAG: LysR family transcriptional regulator [Ghiorsea sp.]